MMNKKINGLGRLGVYASALNKALLCAIMLACCSFVQAANGVLPRFEIKSFEVNGNTLLEPDQIDATLRPFTGPGKSFSDIEAARQALLIAYQQAGYGAVQVVVPEQQVSAGVVKLSILQAKISSIKIGGNKHFSNDNIRRSLPRLQEGHTPNTRDVAQDLRVANESPAKQVTVFFKTGERAGDVEATAQVSDDSPAKVFVSLDNTGSGDTGYQRLGVGFQYANLWDKDHVITLQYTTSPDHLSDVSIYGMGYHLPLYGYKSSLDMYGGYSDVNSGAVAGLFNVSGKGTVAGARLNYYLDKNGDFEQKIALSQDYRAYVSNVDFSGTPLGSDVTVHPISLSYSGQLRLENSGLLGFFVGASRNIPGGNDGDQAAFTLARTGATAGYSIYRWGANVNYPLANGWEIQALADGQYTPDALVPGEQYGLGGLNSVRGFLEREISNDYGYRATAELYTPSFAKAFKLDNSRLQALVFYDMGYVKRNKALPGEITATGIGSIGAGLRYSLGKHFNARFDYAYVLDGAPTRADGEQRGHFSLVYVF
jgi:hemolysin activation/secretion protein